MAAPEEAPLFTRTYDLVAWLSAHTQRFPRTQRFALAGRIDHHAFEALEGVTLALKGFDRLGNLERADASLAMLRVYLRLAADAELLARKQLLHAIERMEELGRMLGGWKNRL